MNRSDQIFPGLRGTGLQTVALLAFLGFGSQSASANPNPPGVITVTATDLTSGGDSTKSIFLSWEVDGGGGNISVDSYGPGDITITGPAGILPIQSSTPTPSTNAASHNVRYRLRAPGGKWDYTDNGDYAISANAGEVFIEGFGPGDPNPIISNGAQANLATFTVNIPPPVTIPPDLQPGEQYRLVFLTSNERNAASTNIVDYNSFVSQAANSSPALLALETNWKAIASTPNLSARDNTGTVPGSPWISGFPIYRLDGALIAASNNDLWDGTLSSDGIRYNELGNSQNASVWTGTDTDGSASDSGQASFPTPLGGAEPGIGFGAQPGVNWITGSRSTRPDTQMNSLYGISDVLTVPGPTPVEIANSTAEFDTSRAPGTDGWTYGYRDYTADGGGNDYGVNDFIAFDVANGWSNQNNRWDWAAGDPPFMFISAFQAHPDSGASERWPIRRWEAEITEPTPLAITWFLADANAGCGGGATGSIHLNGTLIHSHTIAGGDAIGATHTVYVNAAPGDVIDLALSPENADGTRGDGCDSTFMSMIVNTDIPANPTQPDGSQFVSAPGHSFNYRNPVVVSENALVVQENITNFITNYQGNPILRYNIYPNQSSNLGIFSGTPSISTTGTLSFTPRQGVNGTATLAFDSQDNSGGEDAYSPIQTVTITITPVNFPPTFSGGGDQNVIDNEGPQTIANFVSEFSTNDVEQSLVDYSVTNDNNALFETQPDIPNTGTLTFTPAIGGNGSATVSATAIDDGADNNVSTTYQFTITVLPDSPIHYVSITGSNTFPYHTPATAAHIIQVAVDAAEAGDIVQVADGIYNTGGRAGAGENLANRVVIDRAITVRSENGSTSTTITGAYGTGADAPLGPDAVRGVRLSGGATLEGFTISGGSTIHFFPTPLQDGRGGGVFISGDGVLLNCEVTGCHSSREGAGIANDGTPGTVVRGTTIENNSTSFTLFAGSRGGGFFLENATVEDCTVLGNSHASTGSRGGGGYLGGTSTLTGTTFSGNNAANGAGVFLMGQSGMTGCTFTENIATESGGGAYLDDDSSPVMPVSISGCIFTENEAQLGNGGGIYSTDVKPTIAYTELQGNQAGSLGGGIYISEAGDLDHCLVTGNASGNLGGGAFMGWGTISSSTLSGNTAANDGGAIVASSAVSTVACLNTIISANEANGDTTIRSASIHQDRNGFLSFQNCLVENSGGSNAWGFGSNYLDLGANLDADPVFSTPAHPSLAPTNIGDFHLNPATSPALDAGDRGILSYADQDLDGSPRVRGINIDLGVYENNITNSWTGLAGSDWATPQNWEDGVPGTFKELYFPANASSFQVDLDSTRNADVINIESDQAYTFNDHFLTIGRFLGAEGNTAHQLNSNIFLEQDNEWRAGAGTIIQTNGIITDGGTNRILTKTGSGRLELHGPNEFEGGLNHEDGSLALFNNNAAGLGPITASLAPSDLVQADFNSGSGFRTLFSDGFFVDYNAGDAHFNGTSDAQRTNLLTVKGDFINTDFVSEVTVTVVSGATAYFGFGDGSRVAPTYEPLGQPHVFARLSTGDLIISDNSVDIDPPTSSEVGTGTHRVRATFDRSANELTFAIHQNYAGGPFIPTTTFDPIDCSDNAFTDSDSRVFFGGNKGVRFDDFTVLSSDDTIVDIDYGNNVVIANPVVLQRETSNGQASPKAMFPIEVSAGKSVTQAGAISETGDPFTVRFHGGGNLTLGGQNSYSGGTIVEGGRLIVTGTIGSGPLEFRGSGTLMGTGSIAGSLNTDSRIGIHPGTSLGSTGTLTFESSLEASPMVYASQMNGAFNDRIVVEGNLDLSGTELFVRGIGSGLNQPAYIIANYQTLSAEFASVQFLPLNYTIDYAFNDGTSTNNIALVRNSITPFERWAVMSGLTFGINAGMSDDPNNDGITNLQHFALATNPLGSGGNEGKQRVSTHSIEGSDYFTITLPVRTGAVFSNFPIPSTTINDVTYTIQGTLNLNTWDVQLAEVTPALSAGLPALADLDGDGNPDWEYHTFRFTNPAAPLDTSFSRIKITSNP